MPARIPIEEVLGSRFWAKVAKGDGCWQWNGATFLTGYGKHYVRRQSKLAHRISYELLVGPIPAGLVIDHLCRNKVCVNPSHMEPVTDRVNILRGVGPSAREARQTECHLGHPFSGANLILRGTRRWCRICSNARDRARWPARRDVQNAKARARQKARAA